MKHLFLAIGIAASGASFGQSWTNFLYFNNDVTSTKEVAGPTNASTQTYTFLWSATCNYTQKVVPFMEFGPNEGDDSGANPPWHSLFATIQILNQSTIWTGETELEPGEQAFAVFHFGGTYGEDGWYQTGGSGLFKERYRDWPTPSYVTISKGLIGSW